MLDVHVRPSLDHIMPTHFVSPLKVISIRGPQLGGVLQEAGSKQTTVTHVQSKRPLQQPSANTSARLTLGACIKLLGQLCTIKARSFLLHDHSLIRDLKEYFETKNLSPTQAGCKHNLKKKKQ